MYDWQKIITIIETIGDQEEGIASLLVYLSFFLVQFSSSHVTHFTSHPNLLILSVCQIVTILGKVILLVNRISNWRFLYTVSGMNIMLSWLWFTHYHKEIVNHEYWVNKFLEHRIIRGMLCFTWCQIITCIDKYIHNSLLPPTWWYQPQTLSLSFCWATWRKRKWSLHELRNIIHAFHHHTIIRYLIAKLN